MNVRVVIFLLVLVAAVALGLHQIIRRYVIAVVATGVLADLLLLLVSVPGAQWGWRETRVMLTVAVISMAVSALVGAPFALARRRRAEAVRGFDVPPKDEQ